VERLLLRMAISLATAVAAIILSSVAAVFLCGALYLYLVTLTAAPPLAALVVGLATITAAGLIIGALVIMSRRRPGSSMRGRTICADPGTVGQINDMGAKLGGMAARELTALAQAHPYRAFALSLLGGLVVGRSPELRAFLKEALRS
jgi:hypothetical protein